MPSYIFSTPSLAEFPLGLLAIKIYNDRYSVGMWLQFRIKVRSGCSSFEKPVHFVDRDRVMEFLYFQPRTQTVPPILQEEICWLRPVIALHDPTCQLHRLSTAENNYVTIMCPRTSYQITFPNHVRVEALDWNGPQEFCSNYIAMFSQCCTKMVGEEQPDTKQKEEVKVKTHDEDSKYSIDDEVDDIWMMATPLYIPSALEPLEPVLMSPFHQRQLSVPNLAPWTEIASLFDFVDDIKSSKLQSSMSITE